MIVSPFDDHDVLASLAYEIAHVVVIATDMLHVDLLARSFWSVNTDEDYVVT